MTSLGNCDRFFHFYLRSLDDRVYTCMLCLSAYTVPTYSSGRDTDRVNVLVLSMQRGAKNAPVLHPARGVGLIDKAPGLLQG